MIKLSTISDALWGKQARFSYLFIASAILLLTFLGSRDIWTQEHRWADIVAGMFYRQDFLHPYLGQNTYYDKPLLSYWLIALTAKLTGVLTAWALRLPSALAGFLAVWSIYRLGTKLKDRQLGLLSGWILLTTFYFLFWARTSSADMLNLAGTLFAIAWYFEKREEAGFVDYTIFFLIVSLTSLCKGLTGTIVPAIAVLVDITLQKSWRRHLRLSVLLSVIPGLIIYILPFWASTYYGGKMYGQSGLYLVYRENILRYFQPFDHQGPIYTYFIYLPIYLLPWTFFFVPALFGLFKRWKNLSINSKWICYTLLCVFLFFTLSGSRRSYYVLPIVPFAILFTADWILATIHSTKRLAYVVAMMFVSFILLFSMIDLLPAWYYSQYGVNRFSTALKSEATKLKLWSSWNVVLLDAESKLNFYLQLPPDVTAYYIDGSNRTEQSMQALFETTSLLNSKSQNTIFISRQVYAAVLQKYLQDYRIVALPHTYLPFLKDDNKNAPIAFIPNK